MRSRAIVLLSAAALLATAWGAWRWREPASGGRASGPIVFISIDTLRADRLPIYGSTRTTTPNIDALARAGIVFENAYAHSPQTLPSHASILSGQLPFEHGVRDNIGYSVKNGQRLLSQALRERGFATGGFVSSYVLRRQTGIGQGFDTFDDDLPPVSSATPLGQVQRPGEQTVAAAIRWVDARSSPRFFLFAHLFEPHTPYAAPADFTGRDAYDAEVSYADHLAGRLLDHLKANGLFDRATIFLFGDHGEGLGDHGEDEHGIFLYRPTIRVPLIVKLPGSAHGGRRVAAPVQHVDLVPTVLAMTGAPAVAARGRSLVPVLDGSGTVAAAPIYSESLSPRLHFGWSELFAISDERHRFIRAPREELYDLSKDPGELTSIADDRPQVRSAMRLALERITTGATVAAPAVVTEEERRKLAALGYVGMRPGATAGAAAAGADPKDKIRLFQLYRRATQMAAAGQFAPAAAVYREMLLEDAGMIDVWLQLAVAEEKQGRHRDALAAYQQVIARQPKNPAGLLGAANALLRTGRVDEARTHAELATAVAPAAAYELLVRIALGRGDAAAARRDARLAQDADPALPLPAFVEGVLLYQQGRFDLAAQKFLDVRAASAARTEQLADVNYFAADSLARLERYQEAEPLFQAELALSPDHIRARAGLAMLYQATGRTGEAAAALETMTRLAPIPEAYAMAAQLWDMFGDSRKAAAARARAGRRPE
ncbi:MAG: sulfatase-like hydrolase/transferase [Cyanobacteria bacterium]|nr:sulfatase-like hydrolase/transferase [Cyanobacteriota bacterium]